VFSFNILEQVLLNRSFHVGVATFADSFRHQFFFIIFYYYLNSCVWVFVFVCAANNNQSLYGLKEKIIIMEEMQVNALRAPATHAAREALIIIKIHDM
jgi:hypothetical protein